DQRARACHRPLRAPQEHRRRPRLLAGGSTNARPCEDATRAHADRGAASAALARTSMGTLTVATPLDRLRFRVMSAVEAFEARQSKPERGATAADAGDFAWRVLILLNVFRLTIATVLLIVFYGVEQSRIVGETDPNLARIALLGMLGIGC